MKTPMKFTRSLPANARASAKVPESTVILRMFTFRHASRDMNRLQKTKAIATQTQMLAFM